MRRSLLSNRPIRNVALTGGTHGNELCGVYIAKHFIAHPEELEALSFKTTCLLTNVASIGANRRYVDQDMNRCFLTKDLVDASLAEAGDSERKRASEINKILGPKESDEPAMDFTFDLHNTTANTGVLLCFHPEDRVAGEVAAYLQSVDPAVKANHWQPGEDGDVPFLPSVSLSGMTFEVGPVAHSTVDMRVVEQTLRLLRLGLSYLDQRNQRWRDDGAVATKTVQVEIASRVAMIDYPRNEQGDIAAFVHPKLQHIAELDSSSVLRPGDALFQSVDGTTTPFEPGTYNLTEQDVEDGLFPLFVNEAAYYEKGIAMMVAKKNKFAFDIVADV